MAEAAEEVNAKRKWTTKHGQQLGYAKDEWERTRRVSAWTCVCMHFGYDDYESRFSSAVRLIGSFAAPETDRPAMSAALLRRPKPSRSNQCF